LPFLNDEAGDPAQCRADEGDGDRDEENYEGGSLGM
jgi:hypothetical protein